MKPEALREQETEEKKEGSIVGSAVLREVGMRW